MYVKVLEALFHIIAQCVTVHNEFIIHVSTFQLAKTKQSTFNEIVANDGLWLAENSLIE